MKICRSMYLYVLIGLVLLVSLCFFSIIASADTGTSFTGYSLKQDCLIYKGDAVFNTAWIATSGIIQNTSTANVGLFKSATYAVYRSFLYFDTSSIPDDAIVSSAVLNIYVSSNIGGDDVVVQNGQPGRPSQPPAVGDYNKAYYGGDGGKKTGLTTGAYNIINLNVSGLSWLNLSGMTKLCLRESSDILGTTPTANDYFIFRTEGYAGTTYDPYIVVYFNLSLNTSVVPVFYVQTNSSVNFSFTNESSVDTVTLLYRYGSFDGLYNLSDVVYNESYIYCNGTSDGSFTADYISWHDYQIFNATNSCLLRFISVFMNCTAGTDFVVLRMLVCPMLPTGFPDETSAVGDSSIIPNAGDDVPHWFTFWFNSTCMLKANTTYAIYYAMVPALTKDFYIYYNTSDIFSDGYFLRDDFSGGTGLTYYYDRDAFFIMNYTWLVYDVNDTSYPFNIGFIPPLGNGLYRMDSRGSDNVWGLYEIVNDTYDCEILYAGVGAGDMVVLPLSYGSDRLSMGVVVGLMFGGLGLFLVGGRRRKRNDATHGGRI